jgi:hypothetical protein
MFTISSGNTATLAQSIDIDIAGCNSVTIVNITNKPIIVPFPAGIGLGNGQKVTIRGKEKEQYKGKLTILFDDIFPPAVGQAVIIRKKFI